MRNYFCLLTAVLVLLIIGGTVGGIGIDSDETHLTTFIPGDDTPPQNEFPPSEKIIRINGYEYYILTGPDGSSDVRLNVTTLSENERRSATEAVKNGSLHVTDKTTSETVRKYLVENGLTKDRIVNVGLFSPHIENPEAGRNGFPGEVLINRRVLAVYGTYRTDLESAEERDEYNARLRAFSENLNDSGLLDAYLWKNDHDSIVCSCFVSGIGLPENSFCPDYLVIRAYDPERAYDVDFFERMDTVASITSSYAAENDLPDLPVIFQRSGPPVNRGAVLLMYRENGCIYYGMEDSDCYENDTRMNVTTLSEEERRTALAASDNGSLYVTNETTGESVRMYLVEKGLTEEKTETPDPAEGMTSFRKMLLSIFRQAGIVRTD